MIKGIYFQLANKYFIADWFRIVVSTLYILMFALVTYNIHMVCSCMLPMQLE